MINSTQACCIRVVDPLGAVGELGIVFTVCVSPFTRRACVSEAQTNGSKNSVDACTSATNTLGFPV